MDDSSDSGAEIGPIEWQANVFQEQQRQKAKVRCPKPRKSYKESRGEPVVNRRRYKNCPICFKPQKQITRHINNVHKATSKNDFKRRKISF